MIGRVQDMFSAAVVIGAAERAGSSRPAKEADARKPDAETRDIQGVSSLMQGMEKDDPNDISAEKQAERTEKMDEQSVSLMTKELNELMDKINCNLQFKYHKDVDMLSVKMIDKSTEEVIKELPPEEMIENIAKAREWIGAFLDKNA